MRLCLWHLFIVISPPSFEDADEDLLADLRQSVGASNKDDLLLSGSESEGEEVEDIFGGSKKKKGKDQSSFEKRQEKVQFHMMCICLK